ncbi:MAG: GyrI-like domain-containing protein [Hyphomicrobiaceae bacterium]|nr:GyrI-like domain-containing protein [Hyphomicrobiaceae bacterium]
MAFVRAHGSYAAASQRAWSLMLDWLDARGLVRRLPCGYGLTHDNPHFVVEPLCRYDACVELPENFVENLADGIGFQTLPGGAYARMRHVGGYAGLRGAVGMIRDQWLFEQKHLGLDRRRPFLFVYIDDPRVTAEDEQRCDICIPVRAPCEEIIPRADYPVSDTRPRSV